MSNTSNGIPGWGDRPECRDVPDLYGWFCEQTAPWLAMLRTDQCVVKGGANTGETVLVLDETEQQKAIWVLNDAIQRVHDWLDEHPEHRLSNCPRRPSYIDDAHEVECGVSILKRILAEVVAGQTDQGAWYCETDPPADSEFKHGPITGQLWELAYRVDVTEKCLRGENRKHWWIKRIHRTKFRMWFQSSIDYSAAFGRHPPKQRPKRSQTASMGT